MPVDLQSRVIPPDRVDITLEEVFEEWGVKLSDGLNAESPHDTGFSAWQNEPDGTDVAVFSVAPYAGRMHKAGETEPFVELHAPGIVATVAAETSPKFAEVARNRISIFGGGRGRS